MYLRQYGAVPTISIKREEPKRFIPIGPSSCVYLHLFYSYVIKHVVKMKLAVYIDMP